MLYGTQLCPGSGQVFGSVTSQYGEQQPALSGSQPGTSHGGAHTSPGSQALAYSHGSPAYPSAPDLSATHTKDSNHCTHSSSAAHSGINGSHAGSHSLTAPPR